MMSRAVCNDFVQSEEQAEEFFDILVSLDMIRPIPIDPQAFHSSVDFSDPNILDAHDWDDSKPTDAFSSEDTEDILKVTQWYYCKNDPTLPILYVRIPAWTEQLEEDGDTYAVCYHYIFINQRETIKKSFFFYKFDFFKSMVL